MMRADNLAMKIPALSGNEAKNNYVMFEKLALQGPQTVWGINNLLSRGRENYPTTLRAVRRLLRRGYLIQAGTARMEKRKNEKTATYGITWRGLLASLASKGVSAEILGVFERNPQLRLPVIEGQTFVSLAESLLGKDQVQAVTEALFDGFITTFPYDIEKTKDEVLVGYIFPTMMAASTALDKIKPIDSEELLKHPRLLNWMERGINSWEQKLERDLQKARDMKKWLSHLTSKRRPR